MSQYLILFATFGDIKSAKEVADKLLSDRLVACVQFETIESMYIYGNAVQEDSEIKVTMKLKASKYKEVEQIIEYMHPYDMPQIVAVTIEKGLKGYLSWIDEVNP